MMISTISAEWGIRCLLAGLPIGPRLSYMQ